MLVGYVVRTHVVLVNDRESVGEVKGLALGDHGRDLFPGSTLRSIRKQVHNDRALADSLGDVKQSFTGNPTVFLRLFP